jgi:hypothetical protein
MQITTDDLAKTCAQLEALLLKHGSFNRVTGGNLSRRSVRFDLTDTAPAAAVEELERLTGRPCTRGHASITVWKSERTRAQKLVNDFIKTHCESISR